MVNPEPSSDPSPSSKETPGTEARTSDRDEGRRGARGTVLVGVDDSPEAEAAVRWALVYADAVRADLTVLHAWYLTYEYGWISELPAPGDPTVVARQQIEEMLAKARTATGVDADAVPATITIVAGRPAATLVEAAEHADLIVVGRRGRGGFAGLQLGSVSAQVVAHARCAVTVVHLDDSRRGHSDAG